MNWRELAEAMESESRRLGVSLDHLDVVMGDKLPINRIDVRLGRHAHISSTPGGVLVREKRDPAIRLLG